MEALSSNIHEHEVNGGTVEQYSYEQEVKECHHLLQRLRTMEGCAT